MFLLSNGELRKKILQGQLMLQRLIVLHQGFECKSSGLVVNCRYPHLGASPDGLVNCDCCFGEGILEIKYPFSGRECNPAELHKLKNYFLNEYGLLRSHKYFTQVQGQLAVCGKQYCDFVVWTPQGILVERIVEDTNFTEGLFRKLTKFYVDYMLPEIMTRMVVGIDEPSNAF